MMPFHKIELIARGIGTAAIDEIAELKLPDDERNMLCAELVILLMGALFHANKYTNGEAAEIFGGIAAEAMQAEHRKPELTKLAHMLNRGTIQ